jgi:hypothetical protein
MFCHARGSYSGIQFLFILVPRFHGDGVWIPAFAGMTSFTVINVALCKN